MHANTKPFIIGIAGGSGSGKSTLAGLLKDALMDLNVGIISTDGFSRPQLPRMISPVSGKEYEDWNSPESLDYDRLHQVIQDKIFTAGHDVLIVEGMSVLYFPEIRKILDLTHKDPCGYHRERQPPGRRGQGDDSQLGSRKSTEPSYMMLEYVREAVMAPAMPTAFTL